MIPQTPTCSPDEKRAALEAVLASRSFDRSDQLKRFLRYVCEQEFAGQGQELTEYRIGVEALGRPESFSPNDDSIVRNRAYAVRRKLEEYYGSEAPDAAVRIDLPKGNYVPRFSTVVPAAEAVEPRVEDSRRRAFPWAVAGALICGVGLGALGWWAVERGRLRPEPGAVLRAAWGDLLRSGETVLISVATPPQSFIREFPEAAPAVPGLHPVQPSVVEWYRRQRTLPPGEVLLEVPTFNSPLWGDAAGAFRVATMLRQYGVPSELIAERLVTPPFFRNRNVVFFGSPEYSTAIGRLMQRLPLQMGYDRTAGDHIAYETDSGGTVIRRFPPKRDPQSRHLAEVYGLITILPAESDGGQHSTYIVFSGISSAGTQAAAEYFATPNHLETLAGKIGVRGGEPWPKRLQVLVHATTNLTVALNIDYQTHRVAP
jgi:hypothetical protein